MSNEQQNPHLTYKANVGMGRHDWLRLTPAYSVHLVQDLLKSEDKKLRVLDPFSGTGTTGLCAAELGHNAYLVDVNPFLIWLAETKTRNYDHMEIKGAQEALQQVLDTVSSLDAEELWTPPIHNIERWWNPGALLALARLHHAISNCGVAGASRDLLFVAFCNTLIKESNAAFNHQSMSFKQAVETESLFKDTEVGIFQKYAEHCKKVVDSASVPLEGKVDIIHADSRSLDEITIEADILITSPPYVNRMSYIRELRPYMYWLKFLHKASEAGELDWKAIGGTWGTATSKLNSWSDNRTLNLSGLSTITKTIAESDSKNGELLSVYVLKYFYDMADHFRSMYRLISPGGKIVYIIGNSSFYGTTVPAEKWYGELMEQAGFGNIKIDTIRKRNSKKELYEFAVSAIR